MSKENIPRLISIASYGKFQPRALAIGQNISAPYNNASSLQFSSTSNLNPSATVNSNIPNITHNYGDNYYGSLAAISGPLGITLFHTSKPHSPVLVFHHISPAGTLPISSMEFQPTHSRIQKGSNIATSSQGNQSSLLACARGNGVLIWDTTGHSLSPLMGRLTYTDAYHDNSYMPMNIPPNNNSNASNNPNNTSKNNKFDRQDNETISNLKWKAASSSSFGHLLTTSAYSVSQWDMRCWKPRMRPSLRFPFVPSTTNYSSYSTSSSHQAAKFVHVACHNDSSISNIHSVAIMDSMGIVRIYDDRKSTIPQAEFWAHERMGIGVESVVLEKNRMKDLQQEQQTIQSKETVEIPESQNHGKKSDLIEGWVTWGCDAGESDIIRVWKQKDNNPLSISSTKEKQNNAMDIDSDSYWDMSEPTQNDPYSPSMPAPSHEVVSAFGASHISCARVCPSPFVNGILTVGKRNAMKSNKKNAGNDVNTKTSTYSGESIRRDRLTPWQGTMNWEANLYSLDPCCSSQSLSPLSHLKAQQEEKRQNLDLTSNHASSSTASLSTSTFLKPPECVTTFSGGDTDIETLSQILGHKSNVGHLIAAEVAVGSSMRKDGLAELRLCCLTSSGYLLTYGIPEASKMINKVESDIQIASPSKNPRNASYHAIRPSLASANTPRATVFRRHSAEVPTDSQIFGQFNVLPKQQQQNHESTAIHNSRSNAPSSNPRKEELFQGVNMDFDSISPELEKRRKQPFPLLSTSLPNLDSSSFVRSTDEDDYTSLLEKDPIFSIAHGVEGIMQFDMDVPRHFNRSLSAATKDDLVLPTAARHSKNIAQTGVSKRNNIVSPIEEHDINKSRFNPSDPTQEPIVSNVPIDPIKAGRIPCPRLCGASFAMGDTSGVLVFHNGGVSKMWNWFQKNERRLSIKNPSSNLIPLDQRNALAETSLISNNPSNLVGGSSDDPMELETYVGNHKEKMRRFPRTMLDVLNMNSAAKSAQWGGNDENEDASDDDDSSDSTSSSSSFGALFDDSDDEKSKVVVEKQDLSIEEKVQDENSKEDKYSMYDDYFNTSNLLRLNPDVQELSRSTGRRERRLSKISFDRKSLNIGKENFFVAELVDPVVAFDPRHRDLLMNGQCPELANAWQFGAWWLTSKGNVPDDAKLNREDSINLVNRKSLRGTKITRFEDSPSETGESKKLRSILHSPRSAKQQSMIGNIRKLFQYQHEAISTPPPDQGLRPLRRIGSTGAITKMTRISMLPIATDQSFNKGNLSEGIENHNGAMNPSNSVGMSEQLQKQFFRTRELCLYNSKASRRLGQIEKSKTWEMLAQMLENCHKCCSDSLGLDGWGSFTYGALGRDLVSSVLKYYEALGDVQMLATIVCVLNGGEDRRKLIVKSDVFPGDSDDLRLGSLLSDDVTKYDAYIYQYASMLYRWGLLEIRSELFKHMAYSIPGAGGEQVITGSIKGNANKLIESPVPNNGVAPGISFATMCPRCLRSLPLGTNVCRSCKDYAFRCSICNNAVRGMFMMCLTCSHGGHVNHIMSWFEKNTLCPTGCGCKCTFNTFAPRENAPQGAPDLISPVHSRTYETYASKSAKFSNVPLADNSCIPVQTRRYV